MEQYIIRGGIPLHGEVEIGGAKNAALGILAAAIMTDDEVLIENLPDVRDVNVMLEAMSQIGVKIDRISPHAVMLSGADIGDVSIEYEYIKKIRRRSAQVITCSVRCLESTRRPRFRFPADAISARGRSTCI